MLHAKPRASHVLNLKTNALWYHAWPDVQPQVSRGTCRRYSTRVGLQRCWGTTLGHLNELLLFPSHMLRPEIRHVMNLAAP